MAWHKESKRHSLVQKKDSRFKGNKFLNPKGEEGESTNVNCKHCSKGIIFIYKGDNKSHKILACNYCGREFTNKDADKFLESDEDYYLRMLKVVSKKSWNGNKGQVDENISADLDKSMNTKYPARFVKMWYGDE